MTRRLRTCVLTTAVALSPGVALIAAGTPSARNSITIDNFGEVSPAYFRGAQPDGADYAALAAFGVRTVIDLQRDGQVAEEQLVERAGMTFHRIPMTTHTPPTARQIAEFLALVNDPANQPVYVHCAGGRHRTGVMTAIYRMAKEGWTSDRAFKEMKQYKFGADFLHPEFKKFVYAYRAEPKGETPKGVIATATVN
jgi:tyrosine-protein phosphatase SIW14